MAGSPNVQQRDIEAVLEGGYFGALVGIAPNSRVGFFGKDGTNQSNAIPNATDAASAITSLNLVIAALRQKGFIAE
jgi:hypothetical protein